MTFGRYTDAFKTKNKLDRWNECDKLFEQKQYFDSYTAFFDYLKDDTIENVVYTKSADGGNGTMEFSIRQGSKKVTGRIFDNKVSAEAVLAAFDKTGVTFMRRLMEMNYQLYYSRFALNDNKVYIKFNSSVIDGSPRKLYYALKEVATRADKQDDLLTADFPLLKPVERYVENLSPAEAEIKYKYLQKWVSETLQKISGLNEDTYSGGISYLLLDLLYKIDYLILPEGKLLNELEKLSYQYFERNNKPFEEKNRVMKEGFQKILEIPKENILQDLYKTVSTFGIANPAPHQSVIDTFNSNLGNVKWYLENNHEDIAITIYEYTAGYCLFSYGLAKPSIQLFDLLFNITNQEYYNEMDRKEKYYDVTAKKLDEQAIKNRIDEIVKNGKEQFPELAIKNENLKLDTLPNFLRTYFAEIQNLNYNT
jgi:hypothetical protein